MFNNQAVGVKHSGFIFCIIGCIGIPCYTIRSDEHIRVIFPIFYFLESKCASGKG
jgi:hypothetical protein